MTFTSEKFDRSFTHHTAQVNGVRLHYVIGGKGDVVVLLHGYAQTWYEWRKIMPALAEHYTVIAPDLRGAGDSDKPLTGYDKRSLADDIYQLVKQLGFQQVYLVGHDIGLMVAYAYAAAHPDDVKRLDVQHNKEHAQHKLKMPVLALGGAQSLGGIMVSQMQTVAADVQGGSIAQCGHWVVDERPEELTQQLLNFFSQDR